jgi:N-acetylglucosaminyldiphosphoundecaprenol N-acetyl-beta-D-mannosaminyltransferase
LPGISTAPATRSLLGVEFAIADYERVLDEIDSMIASGRRGYLCHVPVHGLMSARRDPETAAALAGSALTLADGMGVVWALRALGEPIRDRVYGPDLMLAHCKRAAATGTAQYLYGGIDDAHRDQIATELRRRFPDLRIAGGWTPPFRELTEAEAAAAAEAINASGAETVWVGIGSPRQELWMARMREHLAPPVLIGVGAAFDFISGRVAQAPRWMQRRGLEWLHRISQEPRRLGPRYLRDNPAFVAAFARQLRAERRSRAGTTP